MARRRGLSYIDVLASLDVLSDICLRSKDKKINLPYFPTDNTHLTYNAHPKLFYIPFEVQITHT